MKGLVDIIINIRHLLLPYIAKTTFALFKFIYKNHSLPNPTLHCHCVVNLFFFKQNFTQMKIVKICLFCMCSMQFVAFLPAANGIINGSNVGQNFGTEEYPFIGGLYAQRTLPFPQYSLSLLWCQLMWYWNCASAWYRLFASAVLIDSRWALTTAHMFKGTRNTNKTKGRNAASPQRFRIGFGSPNRLLHRQYKVEQIIVHPDYHRDEAGNMYNDIALVKLSQAIHHIEPVLWRLPANCSSSQSVPKSLSVFGWGWTEKSQKSVHLKMTTLNTFSIKKCLYRFGIKPRKRNMKKYSGWLCTWSPKTDSCHGDSGGPLLAESHALNCSQNNKTSKKYLQALVSFGKGCATRRPAINTNVHFYTKWIEKTIESN